jgi:hypothetical protein
MNALTRPVPRSHGEIARRGSGSAADALPLKRTLPVPTLSYETPRPRPCSSPLDQRASVPVGRRGRTRGFGLIQLDRSVGW